MEKYKEVRGTINTPDIIFDQNNQTISLKGLCAPENPKAFFGKLDQFIHQIVSNEDKIIFDFDLEYFNTSAFKNFIDIFMSLSKKDIDIKIIWRIDEDDEELKETGLILNEVTTVPVEIIEKV